MHNLNHRNSTLVKEKMENQGQEFESFQRQISAQKDIVKIKDTILRNYLQQYQSMLDNQQFIRAQKMHEKIRNRRKQIKERKKQQAEQKRKSMMKQVKKHHKRELAILRQKLRQEENRVKIEVDQQMKKLQKILNITKKQVSQNYKRQVNQLLKHNRKNDPHKSNTILLQYVKKYQLLQQQSNHHRGRAKDKHSTQLNPDYKFKYMGRCQKSGVEDDWENRRVNKSHETNRFRPKMKGRFRNQNTMNQKLSSQQQMSSAKNPMRFKVSHNIKKGIDKLKKSNYKILKFRIKKNKNS